MPCANCYQHNKRLPFFCKDCLTYYIPSEMMNEWYEIKSKFIQDPKGTYTLVGNTTAPNLQRDVCVMLDNDWVLQGGLCFDGKIYWQAMIKGKSSDS
jgi:hypothetical protein